LDERIIRADLDPGYLENRQYGRGKSGGQVRDEYREDWDGTSLLESNHPRVCGLIRNIRGIQLDEEDGDTSKRGKKWRMSREVDSVNRMNFTGTITKVEGDLMYQWEIVCRMM